MTRIISERCFLVRPLPVKRVSRLSITYEQKSAPYFTNSGVRIKSTIKLTLVTTEVTVEQTVIQKAWPYVKPSLNRCSTPNVVTAMMLMISDSQR
jgi:hypothetical protein